MAPTADPAFQQAMDKLLLQVNRDNVLAVCRAFNDHADQLGACLSDAAVNTKMKPCGLDPVSQEVLGEQSFGGKIDQLLAVHWAHYDELRAVASRLHDVARSYGHTEDEITQALDTRTGR